MSKRVDSKGNELKTGHIYREVNGQYVPFKTIGRILAEKLQPNEETKYTNVAGVMIRVVVPRPSNEPKEPPVSTDPVVILQSLITARPYGDYTQNSLTPTQLNIAKSHEYSEAERELLLERFNYDEQRYQITFKRLEQLRDEDKAKAERAVIEAKNAVSQKFFFENLPNRRKFSCGHVADRQNILDMTTFKKDKEKGVVFCQHGDNGTLPLMELF